MSTIKTQLGNKEIFARNLRHYLTVNGKTQREVSRAIGVTTGNFSDWLSCRSYPRMDKIQAVADYFGIRKSDLVEEKGSYDDPEALADEQVLFLFHQVPKEKRELVLSMIRAAIDNL